MNDSKEGGVRHVQVWSKEVGKPQSSPEPDPELLDPGPELEPESSDPPDPGRSSPPDDGSEPWSSADGDGDSDSWSSLGECVEGVERTKSGWTTVPTSSPASASAPNVTPTAAMNPNSPSTMMPIVRRTHAP